MNVSGAMKHGAIPIQMIEERPPGITDTWETVPAKFPNRIDTCVEPIQPAINRADSAGLRNHEGKMIAMPVSLSGSVKSDRIRIGPLSIMPFRRRKNFDLGMIVIIKSDHIDLLFVLA